MKKAYLLLADGTLFEGVSVGAEGTSIAEIVFNTGMAGYQEVLTDPSYYGQSVCMTYPLIGNYGLNAEDFESRKCWVSGFIMREACAYPSNWRCDRSLDEYLKSEGIVGLAGIDTRRLTRILRNSGVMNGILYSEGYEPTEQQIAEMKAYKVTNAVKTVTISEPKVYPTTAETQKHRVALLDFGVKRNILRLMVDRGIELTVVPARTPVQDVLAMNPDGVFLSNGPGDPEPCTYAIEAARECLKRRIPLFGICLGHQIMGLAAGGKTLKMKFGHHGANHPVLDKHSGRVHITSQNHGFAVDADTLPENVEVTHVSLFDGSLQGMRFIDAPAMSFQGHPEASPGPHDIETLFDKFVELMKSARA